MATLLIATTNPAKAREIRAILAGAPFELATLADYPPVDAPEERGQTFAENARAKALYYAAATGSPTVAEDSGLEIDALGGRPGVTSARFGGAGATYAERFAFIEEALDGIPPANRTARFVCALALVSDGRVVFEVSRMVEGAIVSEPKGAGGFGYDPIFFYPPFGCTLAEAGDAKAAVSHRGQAFRALQAFLTSGFGP